MEHERQPFAGCIKCVHSSSRLRQEENRVAGTDPLRPLAPADGGEGRAGTKCWHCPFWHHWKVPKQSRKPRCVSFVCLHKHSLPTPNGQLYILSRQSVLVKDQNEMKSLKEYKNNCFSSLIICLFKPKPQMIIAES